LRRSLLSIALLAVHPASASCIVESLERQLAAADIVFVATVTEASLTQPLDTLRNGQRVRVKHSYVVRERIKGDPGALGGLYSLAGYDNPSNKKFLHFAELVTITPGQSVLVVGHEGKASIARGLRGSAP